MPSETRDGVVGRGVCESSPIDDLVTVTSLPPMIQVGQDMDLIQAVEALHSIKLECYFSVANYSVTSAVNASSPCKY